jgi:hypothetical protein
MYHVKNILCKGLDVKGSGTKYSDVLDTGGAKLGDVEPIILELWSTVNASGADGRLAINVQSSVDESFTSPIETGIALSGLTAANLAKGKILEIALPKGLKRYLRVKFVTSTANTAYFDACNITAVVRSRD